jgi:uncharacterized protein
MKFALFVIAVVALLWLLRGAIGRRTRPPPAPTPSSPGDAEVKPMLACAHCGVHLPRDEALPGRGGVFCGDAHRKAFEQAHTDR